MKKGNIRKHSERKLAAFGTVAALILIAAAFIIKNVSAERVAALDAENEVSMTEPVERIVVLTPWVAETPERPLEQIKPAKAIPPKVYETIEPVDPDIVEATRPEVEAPAADPAPADAVPEIAEPAEPMVDEPETVEPEADPVEIEPEPVEAVPEGPAETWASLGTYTLSAYCSCEKCCGYWATIRPLDENGNPIVYTASGAVAQAGVTIATDPTVIPHGTEVKIGETVYISQDSGAGVKGNRIDVYLDDHQAALKFGLQHKEVFVKR